MTIHPVVTLVPIRGAYGAIASEVGLAAQGHTEDAALRSIEHVLLIWCRNLDALGELRRALDRHGIQWDEDDTAISVALDVAGPKIPIPHHAIHSLDVERLAWALHKSRPSNDAPDYDIEKARRFAEDIAREYADLTSGAVEAGEVAS